MGAAYGEREPEQGERALGGPGVRAAYGRGRESREGGELRGAWRSSFLASAWASWRRGKRNWESELEGGGRRNR